MCPPLSSSLFLLFCKAHTYLTHSHSLSLSRSPSPSLAFALTLFLSLESLCLSPFIHSSLFPSVTLCLYSETKKGTTVCDIDNIQISPLSGISNHRNIQRHLNHMYIQCIHIYKNLGCMYLGKNIEAHRCACTRTHTQTHTHKRICVTSSLHTYLNTHTYAWVYIFRHPSLRRSDSCCLVSSGKDV